MPMTSIITRAICCRPCLHLASVTSGERGEVGRPGKAGAVHTNPLATLQHLEGRRRLLTLQQRAEEDSRDQGQATKHTTTDKKGTAVNDDILMTVCGVAGQAKSDVELHHDLVLTAVQYVSYYVPYRTSLAPVLPWSHEHFRCQEHLTAVRFTSRYCPT